MSYIKRRFDEYLDTLSDADLFDFLVDNGWDENEVFEIIECRHR